MLSSVFTLGLAFGLATAAPLARQSPVYPPTSVSNAFNLIANVTDLSDAFGASINGHAISSYHTGAGFSTAVLDGLSDASRIFYVNGTAEEVRYGQASVISDAGQPSFPEGWVVQNQSQFDNVYPGEHDVFINAGNGTKGIGLHDFPQPIPDLYAPGSGTYVACNNAIPYTGASAITVQYAYTTYTNASGAYDYELNIPKGCVQIKLLPQCTAINSPGAGSISSHDYAVNERCYDDVSSIDWSIYSDW
ncbi:MAG: hypothetical protein M1818_003302 [Claussenomyces sp. TS43310]|nr:MAG: hypothetical protein M1818_003302 [Claussenomyces sp. TS43310]